MRVTGTKISDFPQFVGKKLLLKAQKRGIEIDQARGGRSLSATDIILIGLASLLAESNVLKDEE